MCPPPRKFCTRALTSRVLSPHALTPSGTLSCGAVNGEGRCWPSYWSCCLIVWLSGVLSWFSVTPWTGAHQALLATGFPRQEYWNGLPFPPPDLPDPGIKPRSLASACGFLTVWVSRKAPGYLKLNPSRAPETPAASLCTSVAVHSII